MTDWESISTIIFLIVLGILVLLDRKNIEFKYGIFMRKIKKGKEWIYAVGNKYKTFFRYYGTIALIISIISSLVAFYFILLQAYTIIVNPKVSSPGLRPIIPSVPSTVACTYALCVPFWFWIIGVLVVLLSHELSHAFVSRSANIRIKSFGLISVLVLPGAFVEPDERQLKKSSSLTKLKIYAAGSFANLLVFAIASLVTTVMFSNLYVSSGVQFAGLVANSPASQANIKPSVITQINNTGISTVQDFENFLVKVTPNSSLTITTSEGNYSLITAKNPDNPNKGFIGISQASTAFHVIEKYSVFSSAIDWIFQLFAWLVFLNFGIGLVNLLPIKPLDGGLMYEEIIKIIFRKPKPKYVRALSIFTFLLIIINIVGPYIPQLFALT
jgi:membrane-associated protease RseP (regulator of RpoE activity)